jgi:hypothetical protein
MFVCYNIIQLSASAAAHVLWFRLVIRTYHGSRRKHTQGIRQGIHCRLRNLAFQFVFLGLVSSDHCFSGTRICLPLALSGLSVLCTF